MAPTMNYKAWWAPYIAYILRVLTCHRYRIKRYMKKSVLDLTRTKPESSAPYPIQTVLQQMSCLTAIN
jgi:hypothetical protein